MEYFATVKHHHLPSLLPVRVFQVASLGLVVISDMYLEFPPIINIVGSGDSALLVYPWPDRKEV